jgi:hypothetical protein
MVSPSRSGFACRCVLPAIVLALLAGLFDGPGRPGAHPAGATAGGAPFDRAGYWAYADRMELRLSALWDEAAGRYTPGGSGTDTTFNANMLLVHAVAALQGHRGPARQDHRARLIVRALLHAPPYVTRVVHDQADSQTHVPGWSMSMHTNGSDQHVMVDAEVADGLAHAWLARRRLGLGSDAGRIARAIHRVARGRFWRWPSIRLNQINWYALIYAADATVGGGTELLRRDLRRQIDRFASTAHPAGAAGNFGPGLRFHYFPQRSPGERRNVDTSEYASIVASFTRFYAAARDAGMRAPSPADRRLLGSWLTRVLAGYWTHAGYLNWDSGLGFHRWHQAKKLGLAQQGLIGMATAPALLPDRRYAAYAKWMLDRGLEFYERQADRAGGLAPGLFFGVHVIPESAACERLAAAREAANAARALYAGLGEAAAAEPPPLYAYDPDTGRLAVTTPAYNTAIVPVSQRAFPYGGIELARLFDGRQDVAANIGGRPPASFGLVVRDGSGRRVLATQVARTTLASTVTPLRLTRAPAGVAATASVRPGRAYAGAFADLRATGTVVTPLLRARTSHRFTGRFVSTRWELRGRPGAGRCSADVLFPSWGRGATVTVVRRDGARVRIGERRVALAGVAYIHIRGRRSGYVVEPSGVRAGVTARLLFPAPQSSAPEAGPTLAIGLLDRARVGRATFTARIAPAGDEREAAAVAAARG